MKIPCWMKLKRHEWKWEEYPLRVMETGKRVEMHVGYCKNCNAQTNPVLFLQREEDR
jgi:hypothetical protein